MRSALFILGAVSEFAGIVLIAFPDLLPGARRVSAWIERRARTLENRIRRLLRLRSRQHIVSVSSSVTATANLSAAAVVGINPDATTEEKLEYLLRRDRRAQEVMNALTKRVSERETQTQREFVELREHIENHVANALAAAAEAYRPLRVAGTFALAIGLICVTAANFV